uniref:Vesicle transport protein USE1 n=1 Tax=Globodera pallida TaxID=36090 RepID=A0A183BYG4_GLOPA
MEQEEKQENLSKELLRLTSSLKQNFTAAGSVLKDDNLALDAMQRLALSNKENLIRERGRLRHHTYQSCFNCVMIMTVIVVIWSFIAMIIVMRVFPKI